MNDKKYWFIGYTRKLWIPVSIEGWLVTAAFFAGGILIGYFNQNPSDKSLSFAELWPILLEFGVLFGILYFLTRGRVDKRY